MILSIIILWLAVMIVLFVIQRQSVWARRKNRWQRRLSGQKDDAGGFWLWLAGSGENQDSAADSEHPDGPHHPHHHHDHGHHRHPHHGGGDSGGGHHGGHHSGGFDGGGHHGGGGFDGGGGGHH